MGSPVIAGRYTLLRKLGQGGMAEVFLARQEGIEGFQKLVVLKRILKHRAQDGEFVTMFLDEARLAADLRHPNVVSIFDINRDDGTYYMAMEFVHGHDLRRVMRTQAQRDDEFPVAHALHIALSAAAGLDYAHRKAALDGSPLAIVHRDVSPQNLIIGFAGEVKVADFGIAKATNVVAETAVGVVKGKYAYMAPEQARGETLDPSADQFALGVVLWEMLTLRRLFRRESDQQTIAALLDEDIPAVGLFRRGLPHGLEDILGKALQRNPARRFPSCGALAMALEELLAEQRLVHSAHRLGDYMQTLFDGAVETEGGLSRPALDEGASHGSGHAGPAESGVSPNETHRTGSSTEETSAARRRRQAGGASPSLAPAPEVTVAARTGSVPARTSPAGPPVPLVRGAWRFPAILSHRPRVATAALLLPALLLAGGYLAGAMRNSTLVVRTVPTGATLTLDDDRLPGVTPHLLRIRAGRTVRLRAELPGYAPQVSRVVAPEPGASEEIWMRLDPLPSTP